VLLLLFWTTTLVVFQALDNLLKGVEWLLNTLNLLRETFSIMEHFLKLIKASIAGAFTEIQVRFL
jgi:hypothetical protein